METIVRTRKSEKHDELIQILNQINQSFQIHYSLNNLL